MTCLPRDRELAGDTDLLAIVLSLLNGRHSFMMRKKLREAKLLTSLNLRPAGPRLRPYFFGFGAKRVVFRLLTNQCCVDRKRALEMPLLGEDACHGQGGKRLFEHAGGL